MKIVTDAKAYMAELLEEAAKNLRKQEAAAAPAAPAAPATPATPKHMVEIRFNGKTVDLQKVKFSESGDIYLDDEPVRTSEAAFASVDSREHHNEEEDDDVCSCGDRKCPTPNIRRTLRALGLTPPPLSNLPGSRLPGTASERNSIYKMLLRKGRLDLAMLSPDMHATLRKLAQSNDPEELVKVMADAGIHIVDQIRASTPHMLPAIIQAAVAGNMESFAAALNTAIKEYGGAPLLALITRIGTVGAVGFTPERAENAN